MNLIVKDLTAEVDTFKRQVEKLDEDIEDTRNAADQMRSLREEENDKYREESTLNQQSISQVKSAIKIIQKVGGKGGFLQNGVLRKLQINAPGESSYVLG